MWFFHKYIILLFVSNSEYNAQIAYKSAGKRKHVFIFNVKEYEFNMKILVNLCILHIYDSYIVLQFFLEELFIGSLKLP